jgi:hypothetical protein
MPLAPDMAQQWIRLAESLVLALAVEKRYFFPQSVNLPHNW